MLDKPVSFLATANAVDSRRFYEHRLGLMCLSEHDYALVFALRNTSLRIQKLETVPVVGSYS